MVFGKAEWNILSYVFVAILAGSLGFTFGVQARIQYIVGYTDDIQRYINISKQLKDETQVVERLQALEANQNVIKDKLSYFDFSDERLLKDSRIPHGRLTH